MFIDIKCYINIPLWLVLIVSFALKTTLENDDLSRQANPKVPICRVNKQIKQLMKSADWAEP